VTRVVAGTASVTDGVVGVRDLQLAAFQVAQRVEVMAKANAYVMRRGFVPGSLIGLGRNGRGLGSGGRVGVAIGVGRESVSGWSTESSLLLGGPDILCCQGKAAVSGRRQPRRPVLARALPVPRGGGDCVVSGLL